MPRDYVQNHALDGSYTGRGDHAIERDLVTELWFDSIDQMREAVESPYYLSQLKPDEPRFVDDSTVAKMRVEPSVRRDDDPGGAHKLFCFLTRGSGDDAIWAATRDLAADWIEKTPGATRLVENRVDAPPGGKPFVDTVFETWFPNAEQALAALDSFDELLVSLGTAGVDPERSFAIAAEEFDRARLVELHQSRVGGVAHLAPMA